MKEKVISYIWFSVKLLIVLALCVYFISWTVLVTALIGIRLDDVCYQDSQMAVYTTEYGDKMMIEKQLDSIFPVKTYRFSVAWNGQEKSVTDSRAYPAGTEGETWYMPIEETKIGFGHRVYQFTWGTVTIRDGELSWELSAGS